MIQDIAPKIFHNEYIQTGPETGDTVFAFSGREVLAAVDADGEVSCPAAADFAGEKLQFLFRIDHHAYFLYCSPEGISDEKITLPGYAYCDIRVFRKLQPKDLCFAAVTAWHLFVWYRDNRFCGRCGHRTEAAKEERKLVCPACGNEIYPKIAPAVIVGVTDGDRIMMTRYAGRRYRGNALIAGFCEIGETVEETVRREVMEEVGLHVKNLSYHKSQPWGYGINLLMGFFCELDGESQVHLDRQELAEARWVSRDEIGEEPEDLSLTAEMIMYFKEKMGKGAPKKMEEESGEDLAETLPARVRRLWTGHVPKVPSGRKGTSAVVIPLVKVDGEYRVLYEKRAASLEHQPSEICFPGGGVEEGEIPRTAAIRETVEELLVSDDQIEILAELDPAVGPSGAPIWPFVAELHGYENTFSSDEVEKVFTVPLSWFCQNPPERYMTQLATVPGEDFPFELIPGGKNYPWRRKNHEIVFYRYPEAVIWGVTAKITDEFLKKLFPEVEF